MPDLMRERALLRDQKRNDQKNTAQPGAHAGKLYRPRLP